MLVELKFGLKLYLMQMEVHIKFIMQLFTVCLQSVLEKKLFVETLVLGMQVKC